MFSHLVWFCMRSWLIRKCFQTIWHLHKWTKRFCQSNPDSRRSFFICFWIDWPLLVAWPRAPPAIQGNSWYFGHKSLQNISWLRLFCDCVVRELDWSAINRWLPEMNLSRWMNLINRSSWHCFGCRELWENRYSSPCNWMMLKWFTAARWCHYAVQWRARSYPAFWCLMLRLGCVTRPACSGSPGASRSCLAVSLPFTGSSASRILP
jgi:hypothetical protein